MHMGYMIDRVELRVTSDGTSTTPMRASSSRLSIVAINLEVAIRAISLTGRRMVVSVGMIRKNAVTGHNVCL